MVIVPAPAVADVLVDADAAGVTSATVYAAAMGDGHDPESKKRGAWLKDFLSRSKMRIAGPNCMGAHSYHERLFAYPNTELGRFPAGSVGAIFQSGGTLQFWLRTGADRGLRFSYGITSGNEADLDLADYLELPGRRSEHAPDRAVHRGHPPAARLHARGRPRARGRQADHRDQDRRHREVALGRAVAHRRDRRRLCGLSGDVRALRHRQLPLARRHAGDLPRVRAAAGCRRGRASVSSPHPAAPSICSTTTPRRKAR